MEIGSVSRPSTRESRSPVTSPVSEWRRHAARMAASSAPLTLRSTVENAAPPTCRVRSSPAGKTPPPKYRTTCASSASSVCGQELRQEAHLLRLRGCLRDRVAGTRQIGQRGHPRDHRLPRPRTRRGSRRQNSYGAGLKTGGGCAAQPSQAADHHRLPPLPCQKAATALPPQLTAESCEVAAIWFSCCGPIHPLPGL